MTHLNEEQLVLYYYGEEGLDAAAQRHLDFCEECRAALASLQRILNVVDALPVPGRPADYEAEVWSRVHPEVARSSRRAKFRWGFELPKPLRVATAAAAFAAVLAAAFLAGRFYEEPHRSRERAEMAARDPQLGEGVLLVAVGDYLERSQMVLIELANARPAGSLDISRQKVRAADLVSESRLYRQTAEHTGDNAVASVLDDLDRVLLEISHAPSHLSPDGLEKLHERLEAEGILFKIRVLGSNVRNQGGPRPAATPGAEKL
jgi:hypothetical protein